MKKLLFVSLSLLSLVILIPGCTVSPPATLTSPPVEPVPVIGIFNSSPSSGGTQTLMWNVSGASSVSIDNGIGQVDVVGSKVISPTSVTTYTLTATNAAGTTTSVQTTVNNTAFSQDPAQFAITSVVVTSAQSTYTGSCPKTFTFYATITANGPGTITYRWERSDYNWGHIQSMTFDSAGSQSITLNYDLGETASGWYRVNILTPNNLVSNPIDYTINCRNN